MFKEHCYHNTQVVVLELSATQGAEEGCTYYEQYKTSTTWIKIGRFFLNSYCLFTAEIFTKQWNLIFFWFSLIVQYYLF